MSSAILPKSFCPGSWIGMLISTHRSGGGSEPAGRVYHISKAASVFLEQANQLEKERWKSAYAWFERAMELPPSERSSFSQQAIQDPEVLRLVLDLLESQQRLEETTQPEGAPRTNPGEHYGRFAIGELLGRGGMGEVYSARDTELNRAVAIKFLSPQSLGSSGTVERLIQEARAASALNHPGIVTVHEVIR